MIKLGNSYPVLYLKAHIFKSTHSAVKLAEKNKFSRDINFATDLLQIKNSSKKIKLDRVVNYDGNKIKYSEKYGALLERVTRINVLDNMEKQECIEKKQVNLFCGRDEFTSERSEKLSRDLIEEFQLEAEQYLDSPAIGVSADERIAVGLYTGGHYSALNKALRNKESMSYGMSLVNEGIISYFKSHTNNDNKVTKTFRGTDSRDAYSNIPENSSSYDAGYFSTSTDISVANEFASGSSLDKSVSVVFGRGGVDVSGLSYEAENEVLYNSGTKMDVLFSGVDKYGVNKRVLAESSLLPDTGKQKGLIDALGLASARQKF